MSEENMRGGGGVQQALSLNLRHVGESSYFFYFFLYF